MQHKYKMYLYSGAVQQIHRHLTNSWERYAYW